MTSRSVVVWGNCQAPPIAALLAGPLSRHDLLVDHVPPVYLVSAAEARELPVRIADAAFLLTQPIRDDYRIPGLGADQLGALMPPSGRVVTFPVTFHSGPFPYQVNATGADAERANAPITDYHDLRAVVAAARGMSLPAALAWWPDPSPAAVRAIDAASLAELRRREAGLDVSTSDIAARPGALMTISHPANEALGAIAQRLLTAMGIDEPIELPGRQFLGERQAPIDSVVASALGWAPDQARADWVIGGRTVRRGEILRAHLEFYRARPDVVADTLARQAERLRLLDLSV